MVQGHPVERRLRLLGRVHQFARGAASPFASAPEGVPRLGSDVCGGLTSRDVVKSWRQGGGGGHGDAE